MRMGLVGGKDGDGNNLCGNQWGWRQVYAGWLEMDSKFTGIDADGDKCSSPCSALTRN